MKIQIKGRNDERYPVDIKYLKNKFVLRRIKPYKTLEKMIKNKIFIK